MPFDNLPEQPTARDTDGPLTRQLIAGYHAVERGWCKGFLRKTSGEVCALGALGIVSTRNTRDFKTPAITKLWESLPEQYRIAPPSRWLPRSLCGLSHAADIVSYNNDLHTTREDVLRLFRRSIDASRQKAGWTTLVGRMLRFKPRENCYG